MENKYGTPWQIFGKLDMICDKNGEPVPMSFERRALIVKCVNACDGMDDPVAEVSELKRKAIKSSVESLYTSSPETLQKAVDEARAAGFEVEFNSLMVYAHKPEAPPSWHELGILPPVGTECEIIIEGDSLDFVGELNGILCKIIAHDILPSGEHVAVFSYDTNQFGFQKKYHSLVAKCFLPAQTEKQKTIKAMLECFDNFFSAEGPTDNAGDVCEKIYEKFIAKKAE